MADRDNQPALFVPLKAVHFEAFEKGTKTDEFRPLGPRWNAHTCWPGRAVTLSCGYGKQRRLLKQVVSAVVIQEPPPEFIAIYGAGRACLAIKLADRGP